MGVADDTWHHVCVVWESVSRLLAIFKDGERKHQSNGFPACSLNVEIEGNSCMKSYFPKTIFILACWESRK